MILQRIAAKFGTPVYAYDLDEVKKRSLHLKQTLASQLKDQEFSLHYAVKANFCNKICETLKEGGYGGDVVSIGELKLLVNLGFNPKDIIFSGVGKSNLEIQEALNMQVGQINVESASEFYALIDIAKNIQNIKTKISLRLRPGVSPKTNSKISTGRKGDKFGLQPETIIDNIANWQQSWQAVGNDSLGIAIHIGSQIKDKDSFALGFDALLKFLITLDKKGHFPNRIDLGGGIGINDITSSENPEFSINEYADTVKDCLLNRLPAKKFKLQFEPGRWLVASAGTLITKAIRVREEESDTSAIILDAGMNNFMRPALYGAKHQIINLTSNRPLKTYDVFGPICESSDCFRRNIKLPKTKEGDILAIANCGAYGSVLANNYNLREKAKEVSFNDKGIVDHQ